MLNTNQDKTNEASTQCFPTIGVIALLPDTFDCGVWMGRHQLLSRMARHFRVVWINPSRGWRELWLDREHNTITKQTRFSRHPSGLTVFNPGRWFPRFYWPSVVAELFDWLRLAHSRRYLKSLGCEYIVLYLTRPSQSYSLRLCHSDLSCYHVFDDYSFSDTQTGMNPVEVDLIRRCGLPIFSSSIMMKEKSALNTDSLLIPNGVDFKRFSTTTKIADDLASIPRPIVGYSGVIKRQLNLELLFRLAKFRPDWSFVLVGPIGNIFGLEEVVSSLQHLPNVFFLGRKLVDELPSYIQHFDIGLMCYVKNKYTRYITPLKLHEYLACGINVVATNLEPLAAFSQHIHLADTDDEWVSAIESCLKEYRTPSKVANIRSVAKDYDWDVLALRLVREILAKLDVSDHSLDIES